MLFATFVATLAAQELRIAPPMVRFFVHAPAPAGWPLQSWTDHRHLAGEVRPSELDRIWVWAEQPRPALTNTAAHETHHVAWYRAHGAPGTKADEAACEAAAQEFARRFTTRLHRKETPR